MSRARCRLPLIGLGLCLLACSGESKEGDSQANDLVDVRVPIPGDEPGIWNLVAPEFVVQPGEEVMMCQHLTRTGGTVAVNDLDAVQGAGGHHVALVKSPNPKPNGTVEDCTDNVELLPWVIPVGLPAGTAFRVEEGEQFVLQSHYANTSQKPVLVRDVARMKLLESEEVTAWAAPLNLQSVAIDVPPRSNLELQFECPIERDVDVLLLGGHLHDNGSRFEVEHGQSTEALDSIYLADPWEPEFRDSPPVSLFFEQPWQLKAGELLRVSCRWKNPYDTSIGFPEEMCVAFGMITGTTEQLLCDQVGTSRIVEDEGGGPGTGEDFAEGGPETVTFRFSASNGAKESPNLVDSLAGNVYGSIYKQSDVTLTGPREGAVALASVVAVGVDIRQAEFSSVTWLSEALPPDEYVFLGFMDLDGNGADTRDPDAGDLVTLPNVNEFTVEAGKPGSFTVRFDLVYN